MEVPAEPLIDALAERGFANLTARGDEVEVEIAFRPNEELAGAAESGPTDCWPRRPKTGRAAGLHEVPEPAQLRDRAAKERGRPGRQPEPLRTRQREDDRNLRTRATRETVKGDRADDRGGVNDRVTHDRSLNDNAAGIEVFLRREVLPYAADAWHQADSVKTGCEISFTRYF